MVSSPSVPRSTWKALVVAAVILSGAGGALLCYLASFPLSGVLVGGALAGGFGGGLAAIFATLNVRIESTQHALHAARDELLAMASIRPLLQNAPLPVGGWAMTAELASTIVQELMNRPPGLVVECGSGSSTALIASCLKHFGIDGHIISLDHLEPFADATRRLLHQSGAADRATVLTAPLTEHTVDGTSMTWYDVDPSAVLDAPIDVLIVDGPPAASSPLARYPAVPILRDALAPDCVIFLDDGERPDEREIALRWAEELDADVHLEGSIRGYWVLRCSAADPVASPAPAAKASATAA